MGIDRTKNMNKNEMLNLDKVYRNLGKCLLLLTKMMF